jgi:tetratricopeptide (TPR) repeat protein
MSIAGNRKNVKTISSEKLLKFFKMDEPNIDDAFKRYEQAAQLFEGSVSNLSLEQIIDILVARDILNTALSDKTQDSTKYLLRINELDKKLKKHFYLIPKTDVMMDMRALVNPSSSAWWWFLETPSKNFLDRFDWLWGTLTIPWLAVNLALIADISSRFLTGTPDSISTFAIVFQSILAALATGGTLTKTGQELVTGIFGSLKIPESFWHEAKLISAIILSISLIYFRASLPSIALFYNKRGFESFSLGRISDAKKDFIQAIRLNPNFMEASYNLGQTYERLQDSDNALTNYKNAAELGSVRAYSVIGRIYNLKKDYSLAVYFLLRGKSLLKGDLQKSSVDKDVDTEYAILRNLGWARLEQERYSESKTYLEEAIKLIPDRASAHCLMAQVIEKKQSQKESAKIFWRSCLKYSSKISIDGYSVELDTWTNLARKSLDINVLLMPINTK